MEAGVLKKLNLFFSKSKLYTFKKGDIITRGHDPIFAIYYIKKGYVRQFVYSENGDDITISIFRPHSFFPIAAVIGNVPNSFNFQAMTPIEAYRKNPDEVLAFLKKESDVLYNLTKRLALGLLGLALRMGISPFDSAYKKLSMALIYFAKQFGDEEEDEKGKTKIAIKIPLTHCEIAGWIGVARETASRQFEKLSKKGIITYSHTKITINDLAALEKESE